MHLQLKPKNKDISNLSSKTHTKKSYIINTDIHKMGYTDEWMKCLEMGEIMQISVFYNTMFIACVVQFMTHRVIAISASRWQPELLQDNGLRRFAEAYTMALFSPYNMQNI